MLQSTAGQDGVQASIFKGQTYQIPRIDRWPSQELVQRTRKPVLLYVERHSVYPAAEQEKGHMTKEGAPIQQTPIAYRRRNLVRLTLIPTNADSAIEVPIERCGLDELDATHVSNLRWLRIDQASSLAASEVENDRDLFCSTMLKVIRDQFSSYPRRSVPRILAQIGSLHPAKALLLL